MGVQGTPGDWVPFLTEHSKHFTSVHVYIERWMGGHDNIYWYYGFLITFLNNLKIFLVISTQEAVNLAIKTDMI